MSKKKTEHKLTRSKIVNDFVKQSAPIYGVLWTLNFEKYIENCTALSIYKSSILACRFSRNEKIMEIWMLPTLQSISTVVVHFRPQWIILSLRVPSVDSLGERVPLTVAFEALKEDHVVLRLAA